jgi:hypothetical protein
MTDAVAGPDLRLVDVVDRLLDRGVVVRGDIVLTVAGVELVHIGAQLVIAAPDTLAAQRADIAAAALEAGR